jgi:hypothetical protein
MSQNILSEGEICGLSSGNVIGYNFEDIPGHLGFLGEYFRIKLAFRDEEKERHFFVKALPFSNLDHRKLVESLGMFKKETIIYRNIFSVFKSNSGE